MCDNQTNQELFLSTAVTTARTEEEINKLLNDPSTNEKEKQYLGAKLKLIE